jgi:hypothetical protein
MHLPVFLNMAAIRLTEVAAIFAFTVVANVHAADRGNGNTSDGAFALNDLTTGSGNTAIGYDCMRFLTGEARNTAVGYQALNKNTSDNSASDIKRYLAIHRDWITQPS